MEKGFWAVPKSIAEKKDLSFKAKLIAGILCSMRDSKSGVFPSRGYMAEALGVSTATIDRGIVELKEKSGLKVKRRGFGKSNSYSIPDWLSKMTTPERAEETTHEETRLMTTEKARVTSIIDNINKYTNSDEQSSLVKEIFDYFRSKMKTVKGFDPEMSWAKDGRLVRLRLEKYSPEQIKKLIDWYLTSSFSERLGVSLAVCLSAHIINLWKSEIASQPYYPIWKPSQT